MPARLGSVVSGDGGIWAAISLLTLASATGADVGVTKAVGVAAAGGGAKVTVGGGGEVGSGTGAGVAVAEVPQATRVMASNDNVVINQLWNLEVWPESYWPGFPLSQADVFQSYEV